MNKDEYLYETDILWRIIKSPMSVHETDATIKKIFNWLDEHADIDYINYSDINTIYWEMPTRNVYHVLAFKEPEDLLAFNLRWDQCEKTR